MLGRRGTVKGVAIPAGVVVSLWMVAAVPLSLAQVYWHKTTHKGIQYDLAIEGAGAHKSNKQLAAECRQRLPTGGTMLEMKSQEEFDFVVEYLRNVFPGQKSSIMLGVTYEDGEWRYLSNKNPITFEKWRGDGKDKPIIHPTFICSYLLVDNNDNYKMDAYKCKRDLKGFGACQGPLQRPTLVSPNHDVSVLSGTTVRFECRRYGAEGASVSWEFFYDSYMWYSGSSMTYRPVDTSYTGLQRCGVTVDGYQTPKSYGIHLWVKLQTPTLSSPSDTVVSGSPVTLTCKRTDNEGTGTSVVYIYKISKNGQATIVRSDPTTELDYLYHLDPIKTSDTGKYECSVEVRGVSSDYSTKIDLKVKLQAPDLSARPSDSVIAGSDVTLTCNRTDNETGISLKYYYYKNNVKDSGSASTTDSAYLYHLDPTKSSDTGEYECSVEVRGVSSDLSNEIDLKVSFATSLIVTPSRATCGDNVTFTCDIGSQATPAPPHYQFFKEAHQCTANSTDDTFTKELVAPSDSGDYMCKVTAGPVSGQSEFQHLLVNPPTLTLDHQSAESGSDVVFKCIISPDVKSPPTQVFYELLQNSNYVLSQTNGGTFHMSKVTTSNTGNYTCRVTTTSPAPGRDFGESGITYLGVIPEKPHFQRLHSFCSK